MKINNNITKELTQNLSFLNGINGGASMTTVEAESLESGILLKIKTPSLKEENFDIELDKNLLIIHTLFPGLEKDGFLSRTFPLIEKIEKSGIDATFEKEELKIFLPYNGAKITPPTKINIRKS